jgi:hypothetical protein
MIITLPRKFWSEFCVGGVKIQLYNGTAHHTWLAKLGEPVLVAGASQLQPGQQINIIGKRGAIVNPPLTRNDLGREFTIRLTRDYGPYLDKPSLPKGIHQAKLSSFGYNGPGMWEIKGTYLVLDEDIECISI